MKATFPATAAILAIAAAGVVGCTQQQDAEPAEAEDTTIIQERVVETPASPDVVVTPPPVEVPDGDSTKLEVDTEDGSVAVTSKDRP